MRILRLVQCAVLCAAGLASTAAFAAFEPFVVRNFRVEGAQRIAEGTIYNYLPINIGDTVDERRLREAGRALFQTGFFQDFELRREDDTLVIVVLERPSILEFKFDGNKDIKDEDLEKVLTENGLATGKTFDQSTLDQLTQSLTEEYYGRGKYAAKVVPTVEELPDNRVRLKIDIKEGQRARIRQIEEEEWHHRQLVGEMLRGLGAAPSRYREARAGVIGRAIQLLCHLAPWSVSMYGAGRLESGNVREYEVAAAHARGCGRDDVIDCLLGMAEVEWDHERYFRAKVEGRWLARLLGLWSSPPPRETIRARYGG